MLGHAYAALVLLSLGTVAGKIELEIIRPAPCSKRTHEKCDCLYQALINERVSFIAAANTDRKLEMMVGILEKFSRQPLDNCNLDRCRADPTCVHGCNATEEVTREVTFEEFLVVASPYDQRVGDAHKIVCIQVNKTSSLAFNSYPGDSVSSLNGSLTLSYEARGYPLPAVYELNCTSLKVQRNTQGEFHLENLSNGDFRCQASAENRVSRVVSGVTVVRVMKPSTASPRAIDSPQTGHVIGHDNQTQKPFIICTVKAAVVIVVVLLIAIPVLVRKTIIKSRRRVFELTNWSSGQMSCSCTALARNRLSTASSNATLITAIKATERRSPVTPPPVAGESIGQRQTNVINIHNDESQRTKHTHNGPAEESYGPCSVTIMNSGVALSRDDQRYRKDQHHQGVAPTWLDFCDLEEESNQLFGDATELSTDWEFGCGHNGDARPKRACTKHEYMDVL